MKQQQSSVISVCETVNPNSTTHFKKNEMFCFFLLLVAYAEANITKTECSTAEVATIKCIFPKNINRTRTDFTVYFYSVNGKADLLADCAWVDDQLRCIEQEGFKTKWPVSDVAEISVPTRFLRISGTYKCIPDGSSNTNTKPCQFNKNQGERQRKGSQDESEKEGSLEDHYGEAGNSIGAIAGSVLVVVALVLLTVTGVFLHKKKNPSKQNLERSTVDYEVVKIKKKSEGARES